jgi:diadenosine tetraphosphate (Ap4A) HIT family hydrolase
VPQRCLACATIAGEVRPPGGVIYEDSQWVVDHALSPVLLVGWLILKTKRHVEHLADLTPDEASGMGPLITKISEVMQTALGAERVYVCSFGEMITHVHLYLLPRYADMTRNGGDETSTDVLRPVALGTHRPGGS